MKIVEAVERFRPILRELNKSGNLVLGGTSALKLHGLNLGREPSDLDIIIYNITDEQRDLINILRVVCENHISSPTEDRRSIKFTSGAYTLDLLIVNEKRPRDLLMYTSIKGRFKVRLQSIQSVLRAKLVYSRSKDLVDIAYLINNNNFKLD